MARMRPSRLKDITSFQLHKLGAKRRNIQFEFTFDEWFQIWETSGHFHERGKGADQYCMSRIADKGPYAANNVRIITNAENLQEAYAHNSERNKKISLCSKGRKHKAETRAKIRSARRRQVNLRKSKVIVDYLGNVMSLSRAVYAAGNIVTIGIARKRIKRGWPHCEAVEMPFGSRKKDCPSLQLG